MCFYSVSVYRTSSDCRTLHGHSGSVYSVSISPDRTYIVSGSEDGTVRVWSLYTFTNLVCYKGHNYPVWDVQFGWVFYTKTMQWWKPRCLHVGVYDRHGISSLKGQMPFSFCKGHFYCKIWKSVGHSWRGTKVKTQDILLRLLWPPCNSRPDTTNKI